MPVIMKSPGLKPIEAQNARSSSAWVPFGKRKERASDAGDHCATEIGLLPEMDRVLRDEFPGIEIRLSSDYSPVLAKALMRRRLDAAFMRPEEHMGDLSYRRVRTDPLVFVFPSDRRLASQAAIAP
jgi:DNA-binding transcriptional LysR family regulator